MSRSMPPFLRIATDEDWQPTGSLVLVVEAKDTPMDVARKGFEAIEWITRPVARPSLISRRG